MGIGKSNWKEAKEKAKAAGKKIRDAKPKTFMISAKMSRVPVKGANEIKPAGVKKTDSPLSKIFKK